MFRFLRCLGMLALCAGLTGCGATITRPDHVPDGAVQILLLDHGRHSSLVLPAEERGAVRYSYGDWAFYAEGRTGMRHALKALLIPSRAALGRRTLDAGQDLEDIPVYLSVVVVQALPLWVDADLVERLRDSLDDIFLAQQDTLAYRADVDLEFVEHPVRYSLRHNSNRVVADWLRELGVEVRGRPVLARWRVIPPGLAEQD